MLRKPLLENFQTRLHFVWSFSFNIGADMADRFVLLGAIAYDHPAACFVGAKPPPLCRSAVLTEKSGRLEPDPRDDDNRLRIIIVTDDRQELAVVFGEFGHLFSS
jgi:hypothetical protein